MTLPSQNCFEFTLVVIDHSKAKKFHVATDVSVIYYTKNRSLWSRSIEKFYCATFGGCSYFM